MCELFALSSSQPTNVNFSLDEFSRHGGLIGPHKDGWGIAYYADTDALIIKEASSASNSECLRFIKSHDLHSKVVISHIRYATQGAVNLENTQPFSRELGGCRHIFAHNGDLNGIETDKGLKHSIFHPIGDTDSEYAFCGLLDLLKDLWLSEKPPTIDERFKTIDKFARLIRQYGPANFIYSDSELLFAHGHKRKHDGEDAFRPPGLHLLTRECSFNAEKKQEIMGLNIQLSQEKQKVVLIASVPLSTENWISLDEGELLMLKNGAVIKSVKPVV